MVVARTRYPFTVDQRFRRPAQEPTETDGESVLPEIALQPSFNVGAEPVLTSFQGSEPATPVETGKRWEILASGIMKEAPDKFTTIDDLVQRKSLSSTSRAAGRLITLAAKLSG